jgi:Domain of unknown function (DUF1996)
VRRALFVFTLVPALVLLGAADTASAGGSPEKRSQVVNFLAHCGVSRIAPDDPIVYPGQPGASHDHTFFGSRAIGAHATVGDLRAAETTCGRKSETAAYWVPTVFRNGRRVTPLKATAYYTLRQFTTVRPYPPGLKIVAGDAHAPRPQSLDVVWWSCGPFSGVRRSSSVPRRCPARQAEDGAKLIGRVDRVRRPRPSLELHVRFPECWDGRRLDSSDHKAHMAYATADRCPDSHPVRVPSLILIVVYPIRDGRGVVLSSGGQLTGHADFFNAWDQEDLARIVRNCSQGRPRCAGK